MCSFLKMCLFPSSSSQGWKTEVRERNVYHSIHIFNTLTNNDGCDFYIGSTVTKHCCSVERV